jgi:hypothetical protein
VNSSIKTTLLVAVFGSVVGCAGAPPVPPASAPAGNTIATPAGAATPAPGDRENLLKLARAHGYRVQQRNGEARYCRTEAQIGSNFPKTTCLSEDAMVETMRNMQETQEYMRTAPNKCAGSGCLNN